jgi:hypothetical protein
MKFLITVADLVNLNIYIVRRIRAACIIKLFINKDLKLKKGKEKTSSNIRNYIYSLNYIRVM